MDERLSCLERAFELSQEFLEHVDERPVWPVATYDEMLTALGGPVPEAPSSPVDVVDLLARAADPGLVAIPGGRFFGFVIGGALPAALAADWLTSVWDQNAGLSSLTPAAAAAETVATGWLLDVLGLPPEAAIGFVTGGQMANYTCLAAARTAVLTAAGWDVNQRGLFGAPPVAVVVGEQRHDSVDIAVRYLGLGADAVVVVRSDDQGRMLPDALERTLADLSGPTIVCLQAGEVHTGAFDPFGQLIPVARESGAWVHVDGAFGLWAAADPRSRHLTAGLEGADSWATDAHKTLNVPYDSGLAIVRESAHLGAAFGVHADYLIGGVGDPLDRTPEFSRRARGFPVWAALRSLGRSGVADLVADLCARAKQLADGLRRLPGTEVLNDVTFTQVMVGFGSDERTREVGRRLLADGTAAITPAQWRGRAVQRCSMSSWATTETDIDRTLAAVARILREV